MAFIKDEGNIYAILGPTNTGKTYLAFDRLTSYSSGIFGFPLRLLARENYDKAVKKIGPDKVALITGEEKILPTKAKYFFCTVESMPINKNVDCVAIDEIQLASDYERGHIFTDRILNFRGSIETIFLGSLTIKNILKKLFPKIKIQTRDRFSRLSFSKKESLSKLKPRSAAISFNINKVYEIAEMIRIYKGGAAVVLGSLSPRTRNAQVEIYEEKKVDYLVATDAIGMGLNLKINHVAFSSFQKFDGRYNRNLLPAEIGQIAGRAGRYQNDGTFSYTKEAGEIDPLIIQSIEEHSFEDIKKIYWRNSKIDFSSVPSVLSSLKKYPVKDFFIHKKNAEDEVNFRNLINDREVLNYLEDKSNIQLLWDVCRVPDFQKIMNDNYLDLLKNIFLTLMKNNLSIPENWIKKRTQRLQDYRGGIEELTVKIANIRTWTYISNQSNWLKNNEYWKEKTRSIEDNLSDYLHESLTNRFIDFSASYLVDNKNKGIEPQIEILADKSIKLNGQTYGYINGFDLKLIEKTKSNSLFLLNNVKKKLRAVMTDKVENFLKAPEDSINTGNIAKLDIANEVILYWGDEPIGFLKKGDNIYSPKAETNNSEFLESDKKNLITNKLQKWIDNKIATTLKPIKDNLNDIVNSSNLRSITYNLFNSLGTMLLNDYKEEIKNFSLENKSMISKLGIRLGAKFFFIPNFLKKNSIELNALLWRVFNSVEESGPYQIPSNGRVSFVPSMNLPSTYWLSIGYIYLENFAVRVDVFERIFFIARQKVKSGPFLESSDLMNPIGCNSSQLDSILKYCGFESIILSNEKRLFSLLKKKVIKKSNDKIKVKSKKISKKNVNIKKNKKSKADPNSPFAVLEKLL